MEVKIQRFSVTEREGAATKSNMTTETRRRVGYTEKHWNGKGKSKGKTGGKEEAADDKILVNH
jgi:hypothetical protein